MDGIIQGILQPLSYDFMRQALAVGILVGILCPVVGTYLVVQRMTFLANVISHGVLPGLALANFLGVDILLGAMAAGIASTIVIHWLQQQPRLKVDAVMNATLASFFALGIVLISALQVRLDLEGFLFGDILSVTAQDVERTLGITLGILALIIIFYRPLLFFTFDRVGAEVAGLPVSLLSLGLTAVISLTIVAGMQSVGVVLIMALMVCPAIAASLWFRQLHWMMVGGAGVGVAATVTGLYISYYWDWPSGATIALTAFALFLLAWGLNPRTIAGRSSGLGRSQD
ncbi:metal ABC transporter permease [Prochlorothrix hollandica]|uniref:Membrane protein n=1 Tax=Prochlorothrix hollandica PCC 9006 = CALU 1027 TaxID=317619 RepID=A0A0M2Q0N0_PROHO|nr:metal ABC transporter permease [Prochlorothrix hollandica]KKJ00197.1 membrane protein [Prochlorothrix hollandica PCC 9006 = CALU 1027]